MPEQENKPEDQKILTFTPILHNFLIKANNQELSVAFQNGTPENQLKILQTASAAKQNDVIEDCIKGMEQDKIIALLKHRDISDITRTSVIMAALNNNQTMGSELVKEFPMVLHNASSEQISKLTKDLELDKIFNKLNNYDKFAILQNKDQNFVTNCTKSAEVSTLASIINTGAGKNAEKIKLSIMQAVIDNKQDIDALVGQLNTRNKSLIIPDKGQEPTHTIRKPISFENSLQPKVTQDKKEKKQEESSQKISCKNPFSGLFNKNNKNLNNTNKLGIV